MSYFRRGEFFPPVTHADRIERYRENKLLFRGDHAKLFKKYNVSNSSKFYISVNLAGIISKKSADFLIGDGVTVSAGKDDNSKEQIALERMKEDNNLDILFYESALANAYKGDSFFKIRYGQEYSGLYPKEIDGYRVRIEAIKADTVFPETSAYDETKIVAYHVAVPIRVDESKHNSEKGGYQLQVESHYPNRVDYKTFNISVIKSDVLGNAVEWKIEDQIGPTESQITGVPVPLIVHVPNYGADDDWKGIDDLTELRPLFDELNNRLSQIASILDKHADPAMAIPQNIMDVDDYGRPVFRVADSKVFEVDKEDVLPQYITWNGQLAAAYQEIDRLTSLILTTAEIPEVALGIGDSGTSGSSGLSIKWRMSTLLSKINRKRKYYEKGLKQVFYIAELLETALGIADYEIVKPKLIFSDGLPQDEMEQTTIALQKTGGAILQSQKTAIMQLMGLTEDQADIEIERILSEQKREQDSQPKSDPSIFNGLDFGDEDSAV